MWGGEWFLPRSVEQSKGELIKRKGRRRSRPAGTTSPATCSFSRWTNRRTILAAMGRENIVRGLYLIGSVVWWLCCSATHSASKKIDAHQNQHRMWKERRVALSAKGVAVKPLGLLFFFFFFISVWRRRWRKSYKLSSNKRNNTMTTSGKEKAPAFASWSFVFLSLIYYCRR